MKVTVWCLHCTWARDYFQGDSKHWPAKSRAKVGLVAHHNKKHPLPKVRYAIKAQ